MTNTYEYNRINGLKIIFNLVKQHGIHSNVCYSNHSPNQKHINLIRFGSKKFHITKWTCVHFHCLIRRFKDIIMPAWLKKKGNLLSFVNGCAFVFMCVCVWKTLLYIFWPQKRTHKHKHTFSFQKHGHNSKSHRQLKSSVSFYSRLKTTLDAPPKINWQSKYPTAFAICAIKYQFNDNKVM